MNDVFVDYRVEGYVGVVTLCNADHFNVVGMQYLKDMSEVEARVAKDVGCQKVRAVALLSEGKHYSAGIDLKMLDSMDKKWAFENVHRYQLVNEFWERCDVPVVTGIQGICMGAGLELALACDLRVATPKTRFSMPEVKFCLAPDSGGVVRLVKVLGMSNARYLLYTCDEVTVSDQIGAKLADVVVEEDALRDKTMEIAHTIAGMPPLSVQTAKRCSMIAQESPTQAAMLAEQIQVMMCVNSPDMQEGIAAFFEKREPHYHGVQ